MTPESQLQSLIADIDSVLLSWGETGQLAQQRQVVARVRHYLLSLASSERGSAQASVVEEKAARQIARAAIAQLETKLGDWLTPMQEELDFLRQQRQSLLREIRELEEERQEILADFLPVLLASCRESLEQQITHTGEKLQEQIAAAITESAKVAVSQPDHSKRLLQLQQQSNRLLLNLDVTLQGIINNLRQQLQQNLIAPSPPPPPPPPLQESEADFLPEQAHQSRTVLLSQTAMPKVESESQPAGVEIIEALTDLLPPSPKRRGDTPGARWYLGIDLGTTGISAVLLSLASSLETSPELSGQQYPIYWSSKSQPEVEAVSFRLPVLVRQENSTFRVGAAVKGADSPENSLLLENFKPYFPRGVPYYCSARKRWEPQFWAAKGRSIPLKSFQQALVALLATLTPEHQEFQVGAVGLVQESLPDALRNLAGVIISCPATWSDTYRFNLREAALQAKLVEKPEQIFFLEEAIAALLGHLSRKTEAESPATTLIVQGRATMTDLALVDLPEPDRWQDLTHADFSLWSFAYGSNAFEQDIFCQLVYPQWHSAFNIPLPNLADCLPQPGKPDPDKREELRLRLQSDANGGSCLEAAQLVQLILQQREEFISPLEDRQWGVNYPDLDSQVIQPVLAHLSQEIAALLRQRGTAPDAIEQVILGGGLILGLRRSLPGWLAAKFPNAKLIEDNADNQDLLVALGLACLPLLPSLLDLPRHQYHDYFLLLELLQAIPKQPFTGEQLMQLLRQRGINTRVCSQRLLEFLEGHLPDGLIPATTAAPRLSQESQANPDYQQLATPLSVRDEQGRYHPQLQSCERLRQYLAAVLGETTQQLTEPLVLSLLRG